MLGAFVFPLIGLSALWFAAGASLILAIVAAKLNLREG
jgi:hypothetical protein